MGHHFCDTFLQYMQLDSNMTKKLVQEIDDVLQNQTKYDKQAQLLLEHDLKQQLGLIGEKGFLVGGNGLGIIHDENDSD